MAEYKYTILFEQSDCGSAVYSGFKLARTVITTVGEGSAIWTGSKMIVWGEASDYIFTGRINTDGRLVLP